MVLPVVLLLPLHTLYNTAMTVKKTAELVTQGQEYGRWTVLEDQQYPFTQRVMCECVCGTKRSTNVENLIRGRSNSCGCINREQLATSGAKRRKHQVNPGDKFDRLTVINADRYSSVECRCVCGNTTVVSASSLYRNMTRSCGCLHRETTAALGRAKKAQGGVSSHTLFKTWQRVVRSGRTVYEPWRRSAAVFIKQVEAEIGPRPEGYWFRVRDAALGVAPGNICWGARASLREKRTKLTDDQKREIVALVKQGTARYQVAERYQVSPSHVGNICKDPKYAT